MALSGREKATIFLSILGAEASARILRYLPEEIADLIAAGVNQLPSPSPESLSAVLNEFRSYVLLPSSGDRRRISTARLAGAGAPDSFSPDIMRRVPPEVLAGLLSAERPALIAFVASQLPPDLSGRFLESFQAAGESILELTARIKKNAMTNEVRDRLMALLSKRLATQRGAE